jgi:hypothetical protein
MDTVVITWQRIPHFGSHRHDRYGRIPYTRSDKQITDPHSGSSNIRYLQLRSANGSYEKCSASGKVFNCDHVKLPSVAIYIIFNRLLSDDYVKSLSAIALTGL